MRATEKPATPADEREELKRHHPNRPRLYLGGFATMAERGMRMKRPRPAQRGDPTALARLRQGARDTKCEDTCPLQE